MSATITTTSTKKELIVVLDVGSSNLRCSAYACEAHGTVRSLPFSSASHNLSPVEPTTGRIRVSEPTRNLLDVIDKMLDETLQRLRNNLDDFIIVGLGFAEFCMNLMGVDEKGRPVGGDASLTYVCNTKEVVDEVALLKSQLGEDELKDLYDKTGTPMHSGYALPQLRQLYKDEKFANQIAKWQTVAGACLCRWLDQASLPMSFSEASWTGMLNYQQCAYEDSVLSLLPDACRQALPDLADFNDVDLLTNGIPRASSFWERWPELREARFFLGIGDGACANIGSKCCQFDRIACTIGTSAAARVVLPLPIGSESVKVLPGLFCYRVDRQHVLVGGALTDGGSVVEWARQLLSLKSDEDFEKCMDEVEELTERDYASEKPLVRMTLVPFLSGERATGYRSGATGTMIGITRKTTPAVLLKSSLEGVTLRLNAVIQLLLQVIDGDVPPCIVVSGKGLENNGSWRQMIADCSRLQVIMDEDTGEGSSRGAALLVAKTLSRENTSNKFTNEDIDTFSVSDPRQAAAKYWEAATVAQDNLIEAASPLYNEAPATL